MLPRFHVGESLVLEDGLVMNLPDGAARHVQVLRMQPGDAMQVFDGAGRERLASVIEMSRKHVSIQVGVALTAPARELPVQVTLAMGMPANDRMDALIEKATELGVHAIQPLVCERSVLRLDGERAAKKVAHWQAVAISACEQSGRAVVPQVHEVSTLQSWLKSGATENADASHRRGVLSLRDAVSMRTWLDQTGAWSRPSAAAQAAGPGAQRITFLSGPEGGLSPGEEQAALDQGWTAITLGARVLRADTAPLTALSVLACAYEG